MNVSEPRIPPEASLSSHPDVSRRPIDRWIRPFVRFLQIESASGIALIICTVVALVLVHTPWSGAFEHFLHTRVVLSFGPYAIELSLVHLINDGLMAIFFFVVGLEIKRELVTGELRDPRKAALPVMAAIGGMIAPGAVYLLFPTGQDGASGWGIPMATDIAFVVGFLALLGKRVPLGLKILLLSLAIADDIGAVLVIALFYSTGISFVMLGCAAAGFLVILFFHRIGVRRVPIYVVVGALIWLAFLHSGVHPTVAGVLLGLLTPASAWVGDRALTDILHECLQRLSGKSKGKIEHHHHPSLTRVQVAAREAISPLERLENALHPWVAFVIMPVFALANAGVVIEPEALNHPVAYAVAAGLVIGKPLGIMVLSRFAVAIGLARLPSGVNWTVMLGAGCLAGIGFTMSLFISGLALKESVLDAGKIGTLLGSTVSAILGSVLLIVYLPRSKK